MDTSRSVPSLTPAQKHTDTHQANHPAIAHRLDSDPTHVHHRGQTLVNPFGGFVGRRRQKKEAENCDPVIACLANEQLLSARVGGGESDHGILVGTGFFIRDVALPIGWFGSRHRVNCSGWCNSEAVKAPPSRHSCANELKYPETREENLTTLEFQRGPFKEQHHSSCHPISFTTITQWPRDVMTLPS